MKKLIAIAATILMSLAALADDTTMPPGTPDGLYAVFTTEKGVFVAKLYEKATPIAVANFVGLAMGTKAWLDPETHMPVKRPLYDNITFHRVLHNVMIQSGDPTGTGAHKCGFTIPDEFLIGLLFNRGGMLAVANTGEPDSGACQFFVTTDVAPDWNGRYTIFGEVIRGMPVVEEIAKMPLKGDKPIDPVKLLSVRVVRVGLPPQPKVKKKK